MNCPHCGAVMVETSGAEGPFCIYCQSAAVLDEPLTGTEGVQLRGEVGDFDCPVCRTPLTAAETCSRRVECCETCGGLLFPEGSFAAVVQDRRARYAGVDVIPQRLNPDRLQVARYCPSCYEPMECHPYYGPGNAVIDSCPDCNLIWLDAGELTQIERAPGRRRLQRLV